MIFLQKYKAALEFIYDLLFPIECFNCSLEGEWLCQKCFRRLGFEKNQGCPGCKKKIPTAPSARNAGRIFFWTEF
jgi:hypothetical protein